MTLEGSEGVGKTTQVARLSAALNERGVAHVTTREPGGTPLAESIRQVVLTAGVEALSPTAELLLMFAARAVHLDNAIRPALQAGRWVICDRFSDATYAYQGAGRGVAVSLIDALAESVHGRCWPVRTLLLDLPVEDGLARARARGAADRFEAERLEFFERVRGEYRRRAERDPGRIRLIDARPDAQVVAAAALAAITDLLPGTPPA